MYMYMYVYMYMYMIRTCSNTGRSLRMQDCRQLHADSGTRVPTTNRAVIPRSDRSLLCPFTRAASGNLWTSK